MSEVRLWALGWRAEMGSLRRMMDSGVSCRARRPWSTFSTRWWSAMLDCGEMAASFDVVCLLLVC